MNLKETTKALARAKIASVFVSRSQSINRLCVIGEKVRFFMVLGDDSSIADFMTRCKPHNPDGTTRLGMRIK